MNGTMPTLIWRPISYVERLRPGDLFFATQPLEVELGSGDGGFLAQHAAEHPDRNFLGVERLLGRLRKLDRKGLRAGLTNLRLIRLEAAYLVEYLLPPGSVAALHIYFPDPWPKRRHHKHRLVTEGFAQLVHRVLVPAGVVYLRTDDTEYFAQMTRVFAAGQRFTPAETPPALARIATDFEKGFVSRGVVIQRAAYRRLG
ncbi:MAG: tRNA (guanosine(46)-N7)-methyltransferase TrmB [Verrucomicrobia bacterium]|nr:tRNA (guanosine(46)-N7)-methyltransferase TrmB [Verrucomicrobiota bacterium]